MSEKDLEEKLRRLTELLKKEQLEVKNLEAKLARKNFISFADVRFFLQKLKQKILPAPHGRHETEQAEALVAFKQKTVLEESVSDDINLYREKLSTYNLEQLEDIFLHIDKEVQTDRFACVVAELEKRLQ